MATQAVRSRRNDALWLTLLLALFVIINYVDRGAIGIAAPKLRQDLGLDHEQFGLAVSAFAWIYAPAQFFVGWLTARICVYRLIAAGLALWALATFATGFVGGLAALVVMRVLLGLGEGVAFPCASKIIAEHVPPHRRGIANSALAAALALGPALGTFAGGMILATYGWRPIFWIFGGLTLLWLLPWHFASKPHWKSADRARAEMPVSIWRIARKRGAWTMGIAHFVNTYPFYFLLAWMPLFLIENRGFTIVEMTTLATTVYLVQALFAPFWGWLSDRLVASGLDDGRVRRTMMVFYQAALGGAILVAGLTDDRAVLTGALLAAGAFGGIGGFAMYAIAQTFAGRSAGAWVGVVNGIGNTSGIVGPILTGWIIQTATGSYLAAFIFTAAITLFGALWWIFAIPKIAPDPELCPA
ncbi:MFS transporter [Sphingomonas sabuli]|uniref:MFS transporter n=1 Tax=Sphingomonas sabuli TaxID=2764186 RepID=A0A7G9L270_9SPHN|nr:MFS transporter [Sphingomonas sabuli]QNM82719.1 MFS transporter [Sphingomonas sabuli]